MDSRGPGRISETSDEWKHEVSLAICERIAEGASMTAACGEHGVPKTTFLKWATKPIGEIGDHYARAMRIRAEQGFLELEALAQTAAGLDNAGVQAVKLQVDVRKWVLARMNPRRFGERMDVGVSGADAAPMGLIIGVAKRAKEVEDRFDESLD